MLRFLRDQGLAITMFGIFAVEYLATPRFWSESFQNWQSEFLAMGTLIVLSIVLRQRGSPESKPVAASHAHTGSG